MVPDDTAESFEAQPHDHWAGLSVVGGPSSEPSDDPCREGKRTFSVWVLLLFGSSLQFGRESFEHGPIVRVEGLDQFFSSVVPSRARTSCMMVTAATAAAATNLIMTSGSPMSAASISKPADLSVRKNSSMVHRLR